jgi:hypothetical protein
VVHTRATGYTAPEDSVKRKDSNVGVVLVLGGTSYRVRQCVYCLPFSRPRAVGRFPAQRLEIFPPTGTRSVRVDTSLSLHQPSSEGQRMHVKSLLFPQANTVSDHKNVSTHRSSASRSSCRRAYAVLSFSGSRADCSKEIPGLGSVIDQT